MPFGIKPMCNTCKTTTSTMWRKGPDREVLCNSCGLKYLNGSRGRGGRATASSSSATPAVVDSVSGLAAKVGRTSAQIAANRVRKSARLKPSRYKLQTTTKTLSTKGKGRRVIFKKHPIRAPSSVATVVTSECIFHDGIYWQTGDIATVVDDDDGHLYYVQLRGFLCDQYCERSAVLTWLLPLTSPTAPFDPANYYLGPEEDLPRSMHCFEFVCHAPSEYYKARGAPYRTLPTTPELGFIWSRIGGEIRVLPTRDEIFGLREETAKPRGRARKSSEMKTEDPPSSTAAVKKEKCDTTSKEKTKPKDK